MWPFNPRRNRGNTTSLAMQFPGVGGSGYGDRNSGMFGLMGGILPGTDTDFYRLVRDPTANAVVNACIRWTVDNVGEPRWRVMRKTGKANEEKEDTGHEVLGLLEQPNPHYDWKALIQAVATDLMFGDAYILKERNNRGQIKNLWWKPYYSMHPLWPSDGSAFCTGYRYRPSGRGVGDFYAVEDVIHIRWALDPGSEGRFGRQRAFPILREIAATSEASTATYTLTKMGMPSFLIGPKDGQQINSEAAATLKAWFKRFTRDGRGEPAVPSVAVDAVKLGFSPDEMALDKILRAPQMAICGAWGIHPAVIFLASDPKGLDNGGQHEQARIQTYDDYLIPTCKVLSAHITRSLRPDYDSSPLAQSRWRIDACFDEVAALAEDQNEKATRLDLGVRNGSVMVSEFRAGIGLPVNAAEHDVFYRPNTVSAVSEPGEEVEPPPALGALGDGAANGSGDAADSEDGAD